MSVKLQTVTHKRTRSLARWERTLGKSCMWRQVERLGRKTHLRNANTTIAILVEKTEGFAKLADGLLCELDGARGHCVSFGKSGEVLMRLLRLRPSPTPVKETGLLKRY